MKYFWSKLLFCPLELKKILKQVFLFFFIFDFAESNLSVELEVNFIAERLSLSIKDFFCFFLPIPIKHLILSPSQRFYLSVPLSYH